MDCILDNLPESGIYENIIVYYDRFVSAIMSAADLHIPKYHSIQNWMHFNPWWDQECSDSVVRRTFAEESYAACMTMENFIEYRRSDAKFRNCIRQKRKNLVGKIFVNPLVLVPLFRRSLNNVYSPNSNNPSIWLNDFANKLAPPSVPSQDLFSSMPVESSEEIDLSFSFEEPKNVLTVFKPRRGWYFLLFYHKIK